MAQRIPAGDGDGCGLEPGALSILTLREGEEEQTVPMCSGDFAGDGAQRPVAAGSIIESFLQDSDHNVGSPVMAREERAWHRQARIPLAADEPYRSRIGRRFDGHGLGGPVPETLGGTRPQVR